MRFLPFILPIGTITAVNAHFQLQFPPPRGVFDDTNEVNFCGNAHWSTFRSDFNIAV
jgi:hypothetical protein